VPSLAEYERLYRWSVDNPADFWGHVASDFYWRKKWVGAADGGGGQGNGGAAAAAARTARPSHHRENLDPRRGPVEVTWFEGATTNVCYNCLDRWVAAGRGDALAFIWEGESTQSTFFHSLSARAMRLRLFDLFSCRDSALSATSYKPGVPF